MATSDDIEKGPRLRLGDKVFPKGNRHGELGIVIRLRDGRATVLWSDPLDYIGTCPTDHLTSASDGGRHGAPRNPTLRAIWWLNRELGTGPRVCQDVARAAERAGISPTALYRAREILRIQSRKKEFRGPQFWSLPGWELPGAKLLEEEQVRARTWEEQLARISNLGTRIRRSGRNEKNDAA